jgi:hypothetical protein
MTMGKRARFVAIAAVCGLLLAIGPARARSSGLPGIPGVPPIPTVKQATTGLISRELVKQMGDVFFADQPLRTSADAEFPITPTLPGHPFNPVSQTVVQRLFAKAHDGTVDFPPGDYSIRVMAYCMLAHVHPPARSKFRLTPIQGRWADIATALFARTGEGYDKHDVQILTWSMLAGMKYSELPLRAQRLVDKALPDFKSRMQSSFLDDLQQKWQQISGKIPGAPSFDQALSQLGPVGKEIEEVRAIRDEIVANATNFDQISAEFANIDVPRVPADLAPTPWSILKPGVYARLIDRGGYLNPAVFEIRVTPQAITARRDSIGARAGRRGKDGGDVASLLPDFWPFDPGGDAGYPGSASQALGMGPEPGSAPGSGAPGGGPPSPGSGPGSGGAPNPGPAPGGNGGQPNPGGTPGDGGGGGGGSGGNNNGGSGGSGGNNDDGDANSPCDPPGNVFGIDKGLLQSDSIAGLSVGKGKGNGVVCLLLRPIVSMPTLGWPDRGSGEVDDGSIGYSFFGHHESGHVVVTARYTYATISTLNQLYVKKDVTVVIDYSPVSTFCPEVNQTLKGNGQGGGWLSGPELENRMCIAGLKGATLHVTAWAVDGLFAGIQSQAHEIDLSDVLYEDAWNHA